MDINDLVSWTQEPVTHQKIVGDYDGPYSLGVTDNPPALLLRIPSQDVSKFPTTINIHGIDVPVIVHGGFVPPVPLRGRR